jgi:hypothetical protein
MKKETVNTFGKGLA